MTPSFDAEQFWVEQAWTVQDRFLEMHSRWLTVIGEHLQDHRGNVLEYWRIEKADSVIVLPIQNEQILFPAPSYRPGVGSVTLDLPGGRVPVGTSPEQAAIAILQRELGIDAALVDRLIALNSTGWAVNSSFSNQKLYGFVAHLHSATEPAKELISAAYSITPSGIHQLLSVINCLQCRTVLLEWIFRLSYLRL